jgi:hypothetical protein
MTLEVLVIALYRLVGSLPTLRWPLAGGVLAIFVDLTDLYWMNVLDLGGIPNYQLFDKLADQVYLAVFLIVALRWTGPERAIAVVLYGFRMAGFVLYELSGERAILLAFPNVFEFWFLLVATLHHFRPAFAWTRHGWLPCSCRSSPPRRPRNGRSIGRACSTTSPSWTPWTRSAAGCWASSGARDGL